MTPRLTIKEYVAAPSRGKALADEHGRCEIVDDVGAVRLILHGHSRESMLDDEEVHAFNCGAAVAFGLMGMAEAIKARPPMPGPPWDPRGDYYTNLIEKRDPATCPHPEDMLDRGIEPPYCHGCADLVAVPSRREET